MTSFKRRERRPAAGGPVNAKGDLPWAAMFRDYGLSVDLMPSTEPPARSSGWGPILDWVTGRSWEMEEHVNLAIDIWRGTVNPLSYSKDRPAAPQAAKPSDTALASFLDDPFGTSTPAPTKSAPPAKAPARASASAAPPSAPPAPSSVGQAAPPARRRRQFSPGPTS